MIYWTSATTITKIFSCSSTTQNESQKNLELTKNKVDEVVDIMRQNVQKIVDRGQNLTEVENRTEALRQSAMQFQDQSQKLQRKQWWANTKMKITLGVVGIILIIIIVGKKRFLFQISETIISNSISILVSIVYSWSRPQFNVWFGFNKNNKYNRCVQF